MHPNEIEINDYVDETLDASERAVVDRHLAGCAECQALVEDLRQIRRAAASLEDRQPPVRAWMRIERAIKLEREHAAEQRAGTRRLQPTAGARSGAGASQASGLARLLRLRLWRFGVPRRSFSGGGSGADGAPRATEPGSGAEPRLV